MKFCAVICEYNPFHNGHKLQLETIRKSVDCDKILCLMSGNFTQRGEAALFDKFTRARHAVENGADIVLELPAAFAVSPAELFAKGAIKLLSSLPAVTSLAFGCESGEKKDFLAAAQATLSEDKQFKAAFKENLKEGLSYAKARTQTVLALNGDIDEALFTAPNNILGVEYCRALLASGSNIDPVPLIRRGGGYLDPRPYENFSSATALRACLREGTRKAKKALKSNLPPSVFADIQAILPPRAFELAAMSALAATAAEELARVADCTEGLENRLKAFCKSTPEYSAMLSKIVTKRYTLSRLKRIVCANLLKIREKEIKNFLSSPLYLNALAVKKESAEAIFSDLQTGAFPLIVRKSDASALKKEALECFLCDVRANDLYNVLTGAHTNEYQTLFV